MAQESRAEYFRDRRKTRKHFSVLADRELVEKLEEKLNSKQQTKTDWFTEKATEEIQKK